MQSAPPSRALAFLARPSAAARSAGMQRREPRAVNGRALTIGTVAVALYLAVVHTYKLPLGTAAIVGGLFGVLLTVRPLRACPPIYFYAAFLAWALVTLPAATNTTVAWTAWVDLFKIFLIGCLAYNAIRTRAQHRFITLVWLGLFAFYPVRGTLFNFLTGNGTFGRYGWNFAFSNFNDMATYTLMPLAMSIERLRSTDKLWVKACALAGIVILPFIVLITQSRAGMLGLAVMFLYQFAGTRHKLRVGSAVVGIALVAALFAPQGVWDRIRGMQYLTSVETLGQSDSSAEQRYTIWQVARRIIADNPVVGVGLGNYPIAHEQYARQRQEWLFARGQRDSHSTYLRLMAETGLVGTVLYLLVFVAAFREVQKKVKELKSRNLPQDALFRERCRTYQAAMLGLAVCAIFASLETVVFPFLGVALIVASLRLEGESEPASIRPSIRRAASRATTNATAVRVQ